MIIGNRIISKALGNYIFRQILNLLSWLSRYKLLVVLIIVHSLILYFELALPYVLTIYIYSPPYFLLKMNLNLNFWKF